MAGLWFSDRLNMGDREQAARASEEWRLKQERTRAFQDKSERAKIHRDRR